MDRAQTKVLLAAFRPGSDDADDPTFRKALEQLEHDAELAAWFRAEQEFDAAMVGKFRQVPADSAAGQRLRDSLKRAPDDAQQP